MNEEIPVEVTYEQMTLNQYKSFAKKAANDLGYSRGDDYILIAIDKAKSIGEIARIMITARHSIPDD